MLISVFPIGKTAGPLDLYNGSNLEILGSASRSVGLAVSQQISRRNIEIIARDIRYVRSHIVSAKLQRNAQCFVKATLTRPETLTSLPGYG